MSNSAHRRRSFLVHLWVEQRDVVDGEPVVRGSVNAVDTENSVAFADFGTLAQFMLGELSAAGLLPGEEPNQ